MSILLPTPSASLNAAAQCREMGIQVCDTIEGRETYNEGAWSESRLTLLWLGEELAVWRSYVRFDNNLVWADRGENADWTLECREWRKV